MAALISSTETFSVQKSWNVKSNQYFELAFFSQNQTSSFSADFGRTLSFMNLTMLI